MDAMYDLIINWGQLPPLVYASSVLVDSNGKDQNLVRRESPIGVLEKSFLKVMTTFFPTQYLGWQGIWFLDRIGFLYATILIFEVQWLINHLERLTPLFA